ncbi:protein couch potato-like [Zeugodacus cucurbitae]|uniref:protein couch potato-like n=1 Tax=Zeugodacus cucurbitae TaxID=28588 RepID=UPI0023D93774|nr:protein couch potato-like [Zeugodacus cucurbitae]
MHEEDFTAHEQPEKQDAEGLPFSQQAMDLQRLQYAHLTSVASASSMSPATTPPLSPPQPIKLLNKQQQQHHQSPTTKSSTTTAQPQISAAVVTAYQQQQQLSHRQHVHHIQQQQQQQPRAEQMISATDVSTSAAAAYKRQQQKLRKLRELHSLALEGGDTARGYCSCDEQWTSSSPPTSGSPTLSCNEAHEKTSDGSESNETTATTASMNSERVTGSAYKQMNVTTGHGRLADGGNEAGHSRTWQPPKRNNNHSSVDGVGNIWSGTRANEVAKAAAAVVAAKAAGAASASTASTTAAASMSAGAVRPVPAVRLKQQHHVRFSDEKNFSD